MGIMRVRESFVYWDENGAPHDMPAGTLIDPERTSAYKGREHLFEPVDVFVDMQEKRKTGGVVESATKVPGEKRSISPKGGTK